MQIIRRITFFAILILGCVSYLPFSYAQENMAEGISKSIVNDVTKLNPVVVERIVVPHNISEIINAVKGAKGPVSIGGGRFSMGGQTATEGAVQIDMREFNKIISFSPEKKEVTVECGATWRQLQEVLDPHNLSVKIMQTYSNFTVGGSLSVNVHGRYIGYGPLVLSAKKIGIVLADGSYVNASPEENSEIFYGAIGGYGGIGVIVDTTLELVDNIKVHRISKVMPFSEYKDFFFKEVRDNPKAIFHNADIYPNSYDTVRATTYEETDLPLTRGERLIQKEKSYWLDRTLITMISEVPGGKTLRQYVVDPVLFHDDRVTWRNYEASYTVLELEPSSRKDSTYVLQEYFVPVEKINEFVPKMAKVLNDNNVNVINISIRHAKQDPGTLLAWAKQEVFAYVLYYKQGTGVDDREHVGVWTRQLIDVALENGGRYYLPYQIHATEEQFKAAYPGFEKFFDLKKRIDPTNKFRNKLWDAYYPGNELGTTLEVPNSVRDYLSTMKSYRQDEGQTFLTMPEWYLVYNPDEYARYIENHEPSSFPYFSSIGQFWGYYKDSTKASSDYPFNVGYHAMVSVIGSSFTVENSVKGAYENTIGRLSEFTVSGNQKTEEDRFAIETAKDYVRFIRMYPWYEYGFWSRFKGVWTELPLMGDNLIRKWERKFALSAEYLFKLVYSGIIKLGTKAAYGDAEEHLYAVVHNLPDEVHFSNEKIKVLKRFDHGYSVVSLPRYEEFMNASQEIFSHGATFVEVAGNKNILATVIANKDWHPDTNIGKVLYERPILTASELDRFGLEIDVRSLHKSVMAIKEDGMTLEHIYDY